jgi:signal transduction histidine kinase
LDKKSTEHILRESEQVNMLLKKLLEKNNTKNHDVLNCRISELEQTSLVAKKFIERLLDDKSVIVTDDFMEKIHHNIRTPLTPIKGYTDMLLSENFGKLNEKQKQQLKLVSENIAHLERNIEEFL